MGRLKTNKYKEVWKILKSKNKLKRLLNI